MRANIARKRTIYLFWSYFAFILVMGSIGYYNGRNDSLIAKFPTTLLGHFFYDMDKITVNVGAPFTAAHGAARMSISLEVTQGDAERIDNYAPRIMDRIQTYMNKMTMEDIKRLPSLDWLRQDLLWEANKASGPIKIMKVNFREFLVI